MMRRFILAAIALVSGLSLAAAQGGPFDIAGLNLGVSDATIYRTLTAQGFDDIKITYRGMTKAQAEACRNGERFAVEFLPNGAVRHANKIGECRVALNANQIHKRLESQGFRQIWVGDSPEGFTALACRGRDRLRVTLSRAGDVLRQDGLGPCGTQGGGRISEAELVAQLRFQGYQRIRILDQRGPRLTVEACREEQKVELTLDPGGGVIGERAVGRCDPPIHPAHIPSLLAGQGLSRVEVIDARLPRYGVRACRGEIQVEIGLNRFGEIVDERAIGRCDPPLTAELLVRRLQELGYSRVRIASQSPAGFTVDACQQGAAHRLTLTLFGETIDSQPQGRCLAPRVDEVLQQFDTRGLDGSTLYVEGCRQGMRMRIQLNSLGDVVNSELTGRCR